MSDLASVRKKISVEASRFRSAVSEFLVQTMGKSINYCIDRADYIDGVVAAFDPVNADLMLNVSVPYAAGANWEIGYHGASDTNPTVRNLTTYIRVYDLGGIGNAVVNATFTDYTIESISPGSADFGPYVVKMSVGSEASGVRLRVYKLRDSNIS